MASFKFPFSADTYSSRRQKLMQKLGSGKILLLGNNTSPVNYADNYYPFRQDSTFQYYIGIGLAGLNAVIDIDAGETLLFGDDISIDHIVWMGDQPKLASIAAQCGITKILASDKINDHVNGHTLHLPTYRAEHEAQIRSYLAIDKSQPSLPLIKAVIAQRNIKSAEEIKCMDESVTLTAQMHETVMRHAKAGMKEYQLVGIASEFAWQNNARWSFTPILTKDGQTLHNHSYHNTLSDNDMILFDGGIEAPTGYAGDMTRTFPVNGKYEGLRKDIYEIVLASYNESVALSKPDTYYRDVHIGASKVIASGLKELGFLKGAVDDIVKEGAHTMFFQHGLGHMIGLDVHDMENLGENLVGYDETIERSQLFGFRSLRLGRQLKEGNCITIEPGIYIIPQLIDRWQAENKFDDFINYDFLNKHRDAGGTRIEDDFVVTSGGVRQLGEPLVNDVAGVEAVMNG